MGTVIGLSTILGNRLRAHRGPDAHPLRQSGFTLRDRADLDAWSSGDRRAVICSSDTGVFAMLHEDGRSWASWGVERQSRSILLWNCVTHADVDRFPTMIEALAAIAVEGEQDFVENVIHLAAGHARSAYRGIG